MYFTLEAGFNNWVILIYDLIFASIWREIYQRQKRNPLKNVKHQSSKRHFGHQNVPFHMFCIKMWQVSEKWKHHKHDTPPPSPLYSRPATHCHATHPQRREMTIAKDYDTDLTKLHLKWYMNGTMRLLFASGVNFIWQSLWCSFKCFEFYFDGKGENFILHSNKTYINKILFVSKRISVNLWPDIN